MPLALLSNWKLLFGGGFILVALLAIGVQTMRLNYAKSEVARADGKVISLQSALDAAIAAAKLQNAAVEEYKRKTDEAIKGSLDAIERVKTAHANDEQRVAALLARRPAATPEAACRAADTAILEFAR